MRMVFAAIGGMGWKLTNHVATHQPGSWPRRVDNSRARSDKEHCGKPRSYKAKQLTAEGERTRESSVRIARYPKQERRDCKMWTALALSVLVVTWTVVAARAGPTGTGEPGETLACTCVPTCTAMCCFALLFV